MIVANIKSPQDLQSKKTLQSQLLDLEVSNEAEQERRVRDYKNPNRPIPIAPEYKTNAELQKDRLAQERQAISNMEELGFDYTKSAELIAWLSSSIINRLVEFNANFKGIKKELTETTNPKLLNTEYLKNYLEKYFEDIDINFGRKFGKEAVSSSATPSPATLDELDEILPEIRTIDEIRENVRSLLRIIGEARIRGSTVSGDTKLDEEIKRLDRENQELELDSEGINALSEQRRREYREERKMYARQISDLKRDDALISAVIPKLRTVVALLKLYSAVIPSHQMLNLLKQSLTQKERGDLVRRYIIILRQSNFLSRSGADELASEIDELIYRVQNEGVVSYLNDITRWTNKSLKALSFVSNETGISKITKLQRDYEVLLNQSGKIGEYERLKQYIDIMEKEISDGQAEMRRSMEEPSIEIEDFLIDPNTRYIRPDNPLTERMSDRDGERYFQDAERYAEGVEEYTRKMRALEEAEARYLEILRSDEYDLTPKDKEDLMLSLNAVRSEIKNLKGAKDDWIRTRQREVQSQAQYKRDIEQAERDIEKLRRERSQFEKAKAGKEGAVKFINRLNPDLIQRKIIPKEMSLTEFERKGVEAQKNNMMNLHRQFRAELKDLYEEEPLDAIRSIRLFLKDRGFNEQKTRREKRTDDDWFRSLLFKLEKLGREKIAYLEQNMGAEFVDYDPIDGMEKASLVDSRGVPIGDTRYGLGLSKKLAKHFREDEREIKEMAKELKRHKKAEKEAERAGETSSDDEGRGGCGVGFRHKKISVKSGNVKVGRGITASETPSYLSFGKYVIHMGHLLDRNIANFKYPSLGSIPSIKPLTITDDYKEFIIDTLDNQKPNERLFNKLSSNEQKHFERVVSGAGLTDVFKLKRNRTEEEKKDNERFELLRGEVMAGNNSEKVLKELRGLIVRFMNEGRIHQREGTSMLMEISAI